MGYTTSFDGVFEITPHLSKKLMREINQFCEERHGGPSKAFDGMPGFWCDYETDGESLFWSGKEKSYDMLQWLQYLLDNYFTPNGHTLTGKMMAQGEDPDDRWGMKVVDGRAKEIKIAIVEVEDDG